MGMRQIKRSIAKSNMKDADLAHCMKRHARRSFFARNWRRFVFRHGDRKALKKAINNFDIGPKPGEV